MNNYLLNPQLLLVIFSVLTDLFQIFLSQNLLESPCGAVSLLFLVLPDSCTAVLVYTVPGSLVRSPVSTFTTTSTNMAEQGNDTKNQQVQNLKTELQKHLEKPLAKGDAW